MVHPCIQEDIMAAQYAHMDCPIREKMQATTASFVTLEYIVRGTLLCPMFGGKAGMHYIID
jgi:hypothetical protein